MWSFSSSMMRLWRFCFKERMLRRPKSGIFTSWLTSSPTSKSGSIFSASLRGICNPSSSTSPSGTISRFSQISRSPLSGLMMMSNLASSPYLRFTTPRNTSSRMPIMVTRSMFLMSLNSEKDSMRFMVLIARSIDVDGGLHGLDAGEWDHRGFIRKFGLAPLHLAGLQDAQADALGVVGLQHALQQLA